jgi:uncharacterized DUF497 family protein
MTFEWDAQKARHVLMERGIDFQDAAIALVENDVLRVPSPRQEEDRYVGLVEIHGKIWAVVHLPRGETVRIITVRRARIREERAYRAFLDRRHQGAKEQD